VLGCYRGGGGGRVLRQWWRGWVCYAYRDFSGRSIIFLENNIFEVG